MIWLPASLNDSAYGIRRAIWIAALFAASVALSGCMTATTTIYALEQSQVTVTTTQPKTVTTTTDAQATIPATAPGL